MGTKSGIEWDHVHKKERVLPCPFESAGKLLEDFWGNLVFGDDLMKSRTLTLGILSLAEHQAWTLKIAKGQYKPSQGDPPLFNLPYSITGTPSTALVFGQEAPQH